MKISRIRIKGFQQFHELDLDLTYPSGHPKAGEPLDKVCFIGRNGTGKSTLLRLLHGALQHDKQTLPPKSSGWCAIKLALADTKEYLAFTKGEFLSFAESAENTDFFERMDKVIASESGSFSTLIIDPLRVKELLSSASVWPSQPHLRDNEDDLLIYSPPESASNAYFQLGGVPSTNLSNALKYNNHMPFAHVVSNESSKDFWELLVFLVKKRESDFQQFLKLEENRQRTVAEVEAAFEQQHPLILEELAALWNRILEDARLEFDVEKATIPIQLSDNLEAYIRLKESKQRVSYNALSTGIRNFIFRLGHIFLLYFQRQVRRGFLLIDEPENSLYPDFLYGLVQEYLDIIHNTQLFVATHNPIIAAQFAPSERVILDFDESGGVIAQRGFSPTDDDPNDLLLQDFQVASLYGKEGQKSWERFLELQQTIPQEADRERKKMLLGEYLRLGSIYNFPVKAGTTGLA